MKRVLLTLTTLCLLFLTNCGKDDSDGDNNTNQPPALTKESLAGSYKITAVKGKTATIPETDVINFVLTPCEQDDILVLNVDLTYQQKDEGVKCTSTSNTSGTWSLNGDKIVAGPYDFTITKWDGKELVGTSSRKIEIAPGVQQDATVTFFLARQP